LTSSTRYSVQNAVDGMQQSHVILWNIWTDLFFQSHFNLTEQLKRLGTPYFQGFQPLFPLLELFFRKSNHSLVLAI
jgi:hypothetical protein